MSNDVPKPPGTITPDVFRVWRSPRRGSTNPERMDNPLWEWLIETRLSAYQANEAFSGPSSMKAGPMWCFNRFGRSTTHLPDGRQVLTGGEHEDHYDPDFYIYNDLVVLAPNAATEIYCYPAAEFPPTDFHSATLTDTHLILIGSLGYALDRRIGETQVLVIEREIWSIMRIETVGRSPGWIHAHTAELSNDGTSILIAGGKIVQDDNGSLVENIDQWRLQMDGWRWERLTERCWPRFEVYRLDRDPHHLWNLRMASWNRQLPFNPPGEIEARLEAELGSPLRFDLLELLYSPSIHHEALPDTPEEHNVHRIRIDGVMVRYVEEYLTVQVTAEGDLPADVVEQLQRDLVGKLEGIEQCPIVCRTIPPQ